MRIFAHNGGPWKLNINERKEPLKFLLKFRRTFSRIWKHMTVMSAIRLSYELIWKLIESASAVLIPFFREFDPGSGRTLAACLTHASRTKHLELISSEWRTLWLSGGRVSNTWATCLSEWNNSWKRLPIPHNVFVPHDTLTKDLSLRDGLASD